MTNYKTIPARQFKVSYNTDTPTTTVTFEFDAYLGKLVQLVPSVIEHARKVLGLTQAQLAKKMKTTQSAVARAERWEKKGQWTRIDIRFYMRFAEAVGMGMTAPRFACMDEEQPEEKWTCDGESFKKA